MSCPHSLDASQQARSSQGSSPKGRLQGTTGWDPSQLLVVLPHISQLCPDGGVHVRHASPRAQPDGFAHCDGGQQLQQQVCLSGQDIGRVL